MTTIEKIEFLLRRYVNRRIIKAIRFFDNYHRETNNYHVIFGYGINNTLLGQSSIKFQDFLGKPDEIVDRWLAKEDLIYLNYYSKGISLSVLHGNVQAIFYHFISKKYRSFKGTMEYGITWKTKNEEIQNLLGHPDKVYVNIAPKGYSQFAYVKTTYLRYDKLGMAFTFYDRMLVDVRQFGREK